MHGKTIKFGFNSVKCFIRSCLYYSKTEALVLEHILYGMS